MVQKSYHFLVVSSQLTNDVHLGKIILKVIIFSNKMMRFLIGLINSDIRPISPPMLFLPDKNPSIIFLI